MQSKLLTVAGLSVLAGMSFLLASGAGTLDRDVAPLYERLGGEAGVELVVDHFLANVSDDDRLGVRFADTDMQRLRGLLIDRVCEATGGPCLSDGTGLPEAHKVVGVTEYEFGIMTQHFAEAMIDADVEIHEHIAAMHLLVDMHDDIVRQ